MSSKSIQAIVVIVIIIVAAFLVYAGETYPRTTAKTAVSFIAGVESKTTPFGQPFLDNRVQVQITVQTGAALWQAQILTGGIVIWEHSASQGEQQTYNSGWIQLPSGNYNFTFGTIGVGSLDATAAITSKGGFW